MIETTNIGRHIATTMGDADLQARISLQITVKHQMADRESGFQRMADRVAEVMIGHALFEAGPDGMHEDHDTELFDPGEELLQPGAGQIRPVHIGRNLDTLHAQIVDAAIELGHSDVHILQRHRAQANKAVGIITDDFGHPVIDHMGRLTGEIRLIDIVVMER